MTRFGAVLAAAALAAAVVWTFAERPAWMASQLHEHDTSPAPEPLAEAPGCGGDGVPSDCSEPLNAPSDEQVRKSPASSDGFVRKRLEKAITAAFPEGKMDAVERAKVIDLMMRVRKLRSSQQGNGLDDDTPPALRDDFHAAQIEFTELTGLGVAEFIEILEAGDPRVARRPEDAPPIENGEVRKRFADEDAVRSGITRPGSVEVFEDGEWKSR